MSIQRAPFKLFVNLRANCHMFWTNWIQLAHNVAEKGLKPYPAVVVDGKLLAFQAAHALAPQAASMTGESLGKAKGTIWSFQQGLIFSLGLGGHKC
eukprot:s154_g95.t1